MPNALHESLIQRGCNLLLHMRPSMLYGIALAICGLIYVSQYWSPSSYGLVLQRIRANEVGTVFGQPRPIRSDEWAVVTPLTQATVNNGFERTNRTSFYTEDLRINYGLPIFDWGLVFKPTMWLYLFVDPAHAYSFHWFSVLALFLLGHALLFNRLGFSHFESVTLSVALYFSGFTQFWWNEKGPEFAYFPWIVFVLLLRQPIYVRLGLFYWLGSSWLLTNFYPPVFISLAFVGALIVLVYDTDWLKPRRLLMLAGTTVLVSLTVLLYLKDYLTKTASTDYPGHRNVGGGAVPWQEWWAQLFPYATFDWSYQSTIGQNICEVGVVGSTLILMTIVFLDYRKLICSMVAQPLLRMRLSVLGVGWGMMTAWMLLPLPAWVGYILLWNNVQPERMEYAAGLILILVAAIAAKNGQLVVTRFRMVIYTGIVIVGWVIIKQISASTGPQAVVERSNDLVILPVLFLLLFANHKFNIAPYKLCFLASALCGGIVLFSFNPIQSARDFFTKHDTRFTRLLDKEAQIYGGVLAFPGMGGATLNGLGYRSVSHVTAVPALEFWRKKYMDIPEDEFMAIFNRYSHISLISEPKPKLVNADNVGVPLADFLPGYTELPVGHMGKAVPVWLEQGHRVSGAFPITRSGKVNALYVFIGNGHHTSDGIMQLKLCFEKACTYAEKKLKHTFDNAYAAYYFEKPLNVVGDGLTHYEFSLAGGQRPVAFWTYPPMEDTSLEFAMDGVARQTLPRLGIHMVTEQN